MSGNLTELEAAMLERLRLMEWHYYDPDGKVYRCPCCHHIYAAGHYKNCPLPELIAKAEAKAQGKEVQS